MVIGNRAYKVLKEISYERLGGTKEEMNALEIIKHEVEMLGVESTVGVGTTFTVKVRRKTDESEKTR